MVIPRHNISVFKLLCVILCVCPLSLCTTAHAQCNDEKSPNDLSWDFDEGKNKGFSIGAFVSDIFTPSIILDTKRIREYICDARFQILRGQCGDIRAIDAIYLKSLKIAEYNIARALFLSFMAVLEHRNVDIKMPIFKSLALPLTFEADSIFYARVKNLPTQVYADTPPGSHGDNDKLQHFFGSAYLAFASESPGFTRTTGNLIEWGEEKLVVGGTDDPRDKRANEQGKSFGRDLLVVKTLLPSDYLILPHEGRK
ncbi:MAG: hypothetical protein NTX44_09210 [Ignavibacteriales bacterium]|nr:hypothetical protein [Ignavibacteriales bacterium]